MNEEKVYIEALSRKDPAERARFLDDACGNNQHLRDRLDRLFQHGEQADRFLEEPAMPTVSNVDLSPLPDSFNSTIGPYTLREQIGEGGMGVVYVAEQAEPVKRKVALKIIRLGLATKEVIARFESERQALAMMDHPNIARVFDGGVADTGQSFFVMELVPGLPITEYCDQKRLSTRERLRLFITVCEAVHHAHQKGIIHRDLKPTNVLVAEIDGKAVPKVIDFGVAKATSDKLTLQTVYTHFAQMVGTPLYMSPEQASLGGTDVDTRSDVYSLGVLLYELLTSKTPFSSAAFKEAGFDEMRRIIREDEPSRPSALVNTLDGRALSTAASCRGVDARHLTSLLRGELDWLVMKSLEKDRNRRYGSAIALAEDVDRFLASQPIAAGPPSTVYRFKKFVQRNQARLIPASVVAIVLLLGLTTSLVALLQERAAKESLQNETARRLYASQMVRAFAAWEDRDIGTLKDLLARTTPPTLESPDFRDWEWHFLSEQVRRVFVSIPQKYVNQAAWNPRRDEIAVIVDSKEKTSAVEIWKPGSDSPVRKVAELSGPNPWWTTMTWSLSGDRFAVGLHEEGRVIVFNAETGAALFDRQVHQGENVGGRVRAIALSPTEDILATANFFGQIKIWDLSTGQLVDVLFEPRERENLHCIAFSPDGAHLAATLRFGQRVVWNVKSKDRFDYERVGMGSLGRLEWSPDGKRLVATDDQEVAVYQWNASKFIAKPIFKNDHRGATDACWLDDHLLASCGQDQTIRIWDLHQAKMVGSLRLDAPLRHLDVSSDGRSLAVLGSKGLSVVGPGLGNQLGYNVLQPASIESGRSSDLRWSSGGYLRWSRDGNRIAVKQFSHGVNQGDGETKLRIYDLRTSQIITTHDEVEHSGIFYWAADDTRILVFGRGGGRYEYGVTDPIVRNIHGKIQGVSHIHRNLALNQQLSLLAVGIDYQGVRICDAVNLQVEDRLPHTAHGYHTNLAWSPDNQSLLCATVVGVDLQVRIYDALRRQTRTLQPPPQDRAGSDPVCVAWDTTSTEIAIGTSEPAIHIWDIASGKPRAKLIGHRSPIQELSWSPSGMRIASCAEDGSIHIWDANRGDLLAVLHPPNESTVFHSVRWSPDGQRLAASGSAGELYILDAGNSMSDAPNGKPKVAEKRMKPASQ